MSWLFASGGQSIGASALILPGQADMSLGVQGSGLSTYAPSVMLRKQHPSLPPLLHLECNVSFCGRSPFLSARQKVLLPHMEAL